MRLQQPTVGSTWIEVERGYSPLDVIRVWDTYFDGDDRSVVAFEIIDGRNGPLVGEPLAARNRRIWPLVAFLRDFQPEETPT